MTMKKKLLTTLSVVLILGMAALGILAYLQSEDSDVNVMTLGNVQIEQIEQERDANGNLVDFTQGKPAFPAVGPIDWAATGVKVNGTEYKVFTPDLKNVVDKIVTVKNTGKSDAYVRTIVAIEAPDYDPNDLIHINHNSNGVKISNPICVTVDEVDYVAFVFTYENAVAAGETSAPSLMQVFLDSKATNEDVAKFGDAWEILVLSQAVQAEGFADAKTALDTAFGEISANNHPWKEASFVDSAAELKDAIANGGKVTLTNDIAIAKNETVTVASGNNVTIDLNGFEISNSADKSGNQEMFLVKGNMTVKNGKMKMTAENNQEWNAMATIFDVTAGGVLNLENVKAEVGGTDMNFIVHLNNWGEATLNANNCEFTASYVAVRAFNSGYDMNNITIKNTEFKKGRAFWVHNYTSEGKDDTTLNLNIYNNNNTSDHSKPVRFGYSNSTYYDINGNLIP